MLRSAPASHTWTIVAPTRRRPSTTIDSGPAPTRRRAPTATFLFSHDNRAADLDFECSLDGAPFTRLRLAVRAHRPRRRHAHARRRRDRRGRQRRRDAGQPHLDGRRAAAAEHADGHDVDGRPDRRRCRPRSPSPRSRRPATPRSSTLATPPALPDGLPTDGAVYYDISTTAVYGDPVTRLHPVQRRRVRRCPPALLHHDGSEWVDITLDRRGRHGCGGPTRLSPFAIAASSPPVVPETTIQTGPERPRDRRRPSRSPRTTPTASFECALDDPARVELVRRRSGLEGLLLGQHELLVRAVNELGLFDATPAATRWTVVPPETTIDTGPPASHASTRSATFTFSSNDPLATFECALDGASFGSCETPYQLEDLLAGQHELLVRAKNVAGVFDPTPGRATAGRSGRCPTRRSSTARPTRPTPHRDLHVRLRPAGRHLRVRARRGGRRRSSRRAPRRSPTPTSSSASTTSPSAPATPTATST